MGAARKIEIRHIDRLGALLVKQKRVKILVGGRASTKSTFVADHCIEQMSRGRVWCCAREYLNSIDESVHSLLQDEIERLEYPGFEIQRTVINHVSGGRSFYRGLARNITSLKGLQCDVLWIEEGESLSADTLKIVTASVRITALEQEKARREDRDVKIPEIWITMNRGSSKDPIAQRFLERAERELERTGYYEDDLCVIMEVNYDENPWFLESGLEVERQDDEKYLSRAAYEHKWHGKYSDTIENAIIEPEWFDACVDAHKVLGFKPEGIEVVAHDPFDGGSDAAAIAHRHGSVIVHAEESNQGRVNDACDWALDYVHQVKPDAFVWDAGGIGAGLKRQITDAIGDKKIDIQSFEGQAQVDNPKSQYDPTPGMVMKAKTNAEAFYNRRAQRYWQLRDRIYRTYLAVQDQRYTDPGELISFSSEIPCLHLLRSELCRVPRKNNGAGKIQIMSKPEMAKEGISSPNLADCVMMTLDVGGVKTQRVKLNFSGWSG